MFLFDYILLIFVIFSAVIVSSQSCCDGPPDIRIVGPPPSPLPGLDFGLSCPTDVSGSTKHVSLTSTPIIDVHNTPKLQNDVTDRDTVTRFKTSAVVSDPTSSPDTTADVDGQTRDKVVQITLIVFIVILVVAIFVLIFFFLTKIYVRYRVGPSPLHDDDGSSITTPTQHGSGMSWPSLSNKISRTWLKLEDRQNSVPNGRPPLVIKSTF